MPPADVIKKATDCGGLSFSNAASLAASAKAGSLIAAIISFSAWWWTGSKHRQLQFYGSAVVTVGGNDGKICRSFPAHCAS